MDMREVINEINPNSKDYQNINLENLQAELVGTKGARIVSLTTMVIPELKQLIDRPCVFDYEIMKISHINGIINFNYTEAVNRQRVREGKLPDFIPQKRKWGTRIEGTSFISHIKKNTGEHKLYLEIKIEKSIDHLYYQPSKKKIIDDEIVDPYLKDKSNAINQDLEKEIIVRTYDVKHIACIVIDGQGYFIEENLN